MINSINPNLGPIGPGSLGGAGKAGGAPVGGTNFSDLLKEQIGEVSQLQQDASKAVEDLATGRLVPLFEHDLPPPRPVHLLYPRDRQPLPKLSRFVEAVMEAMGA